MLHLFERAFHGVNALYSVLLAGAMLYWLGMIAGIFHLDHEGGEIADGGGEADDVPGGLEIHHDADLPLWQEVTSFFLPGKVPVTVALSLLAIGWWTASMLLTWVINPAGVLWIDLVLQIPVIFAGLLVLKFLGRPVGLLMWQLQADSEPNLPGKIGRVVLTVARGRTGQVEVMADGAPLLLNAVTDQEESLLPGTRVLVLGRQDESTLLVSPFVPEEE